MSLMIRSRGFTLIELLVVIAIIGILASIVLASLNGARAKAKDIKRVANLNSVRQALELYFTDHNSYPIPATTPTGHHSTCSTWVGDAPNDVMPGLVPQYLPELPEDPDTNGVNRCCYLYRQTGNGSDYKFLLYACQAYTDYASRPAFIDPRRDGGTDNCSQDGTTYTAWAVYSDGGCAL